MKDKLYVACVKQGTMYSSIYVNVLKNMVKRHLPLQYEFVCFTDDEKGLDNDITIKPLPENVPGWWAKLYLFSENAGLNGIVFYLDLDTVVCGDLNKIINYHFTKKNKILMCSSIMDCTGLSKNQNKAISYADNIVTSIKNSLQYKLLKYGLKYTACLMVWDNTKKISIWNDFLSDKEKIMKEYVSDSDFTTLKYKNLVEGIPHQWFFYYETGRKLITDHAAYNNKFMKTGFNEELYKLKDKDIALFNKLSSAELKVFTTKENITVNKNVSLCLFSGYPKPHTVLDDFITNNWK